MSALVLLIRRAWHMHDITRPVCMCHVLKAIAPHSHALSTRKGLGLGLTSANT